MKTKVSDTENEVDEEHKSKSSAEMPGVSASAGQICFMDKMTSYLVSTFSKGIDVSNYLMKNEYDSDCIMIDLFSTNETDSIIAKQFGQQDNYYQSMRQYARQSAGIRVIGISGATRSGKSSLSRQLSKSLGSTKCAIIHQDHFFDTTKIYSELNGNWDCPQAIDHNAFYKELCQQIERHKQLSPVSHKNEYFYIILEGFMLFYDNRIVECIDHFLWLEISRKVCYERRMETKRESRQYFDENIWPNHKQYKKMVFQRDIKDKIVILDGTDPLNKSLDTALQQITSIKETKYSPLQQEM